MPQEIKYKLRIKAILKSKGLSVSKFAKQSGFYGSNIGDIINGNTSPKIKTLSAIADALDVEIHELFETSENYQHIYNEHGEWRGIMPKCKGSE